MIDNYKFPGIELLNISKENIDNKKEILNIKAEIIKQTLENFKINVTIEDISFNQRIIRYEIKPDKGIRMKRIMLLTEDIALNLGVKNIRIEAIPEKQTIGIEIPNEKNKIVNIRNIIESQSFQKDISEIIFIIGEDINGNKITGNISDMPHILIAGATGSGKSVFINSLIISMLYKSNPDNLKLILIDPKRVELSVYNELPHLISPIVTTSDEATKLLEWGIKEMMRRYDLFAENEVKNIDKYNEKNTNDVLPRIIIIIDEFADLMMSSPEKFESLICRLAQMARAAGIHLIIATQRPSVNVITGIIKANIPSRISFATASYIDSRIILDMKGAEKLLGKGDMLYHPLGEMNPIRIQGCFVSDEEIERVVSFIKTNNEKVVYNEEVINLLSDQKIQKEYKNTIYYYNGELMTNEELNMLSYRI